jgi:hypothetical protein
MRAKLLGVLAGLVLVPLALQAGPIRQEFCGEPYYWFLDEPAVFSSTADGRTIEIRPIDDNCWIDCFNIYSNDGPIEGRFRILAADGTVGETGTWRAETVLYKYDVCPVNVSYLFGGRLVYRLYFTASDGAEFGGTMELRNDGDSWDALGTMRVWIGSRGLQFDRPTPTRMWFWAA